MDGVYIVRIIRRIAMWFLLGLAVPSDALSGENAPDRSREILERIEADPARRAHLLRELKTFQQLPPAQQERLRKIDQALHEPSVATAARLNRTLSRYMEWLDSLPESKRAYVESAADPDERLRRVRHLREEEWIDRLPKAQRDQVRSSAGQERESLIKKLKAEEQARRKEWQTAIRHWDELQKGKPPTRRSELTTDAQTFVEKILLPRATTADAARLESAEGNWPQFMETLVELSDRYAPFPGQPKPKDPKDLPEDLRKRLVNVRPPQQRQALQAAEGKWPDYPLAIVSALRRPRGLSPLPPRLAPTRPADFDEPVQLFIREQLVPRLKADEHRQLTNAEGSWPEYPRMVVQLAGKHNLIVPGVLPIPKVHADKYRMKSSAQPDVGASR
jgi:hypothetical protein